MSKTVDANLATSRDVPQPLPTRSTRREFTRLLWKEMLALRNFAGIMAAVLSVTCGVLWAWRPELSQEVRLLLLSLPQLVAIVFAIGSGTLLFSQEDETGTLGFLRGMGVSSRSLVNAKLTAGLLCLILLVVGTAGIGWQPPSDPEMSTSRGSILVTSCGVGLVVLLWTSLWSMAIRRELPTVCCGLLGVLLLKPFVELWDETGLLVLSGVFASGLWLLCQVAASRWLGSGGWWWQTNDSATASDNSAELTRDDTNALPGLFGCESSVIRVSVGGTIAMGVVLWLLLMMWWAQESRFGRWPENLEMVWSMLVSGVLGWMPVRLEQRETRSIGRAYVQNWRQKLATGPIPWLLLWWLLSLGLMWAYRPNNSLEVTPVMLLRFCWDELLPWSILAFGSLRLMARLCSGGWLAWPLSTLPLGAGWCVWWLLAILGEPAWWGLLMIGVLFNSASWWHWQLTRRGQTAWRASLSVSGGTVGCLVLSWGLLNWWRVAEIPQDWVGAAKPTPLAVTSDAEARERAEQGVELAALVARVQPAPTVQWEDGRKFPCFASDWNIIDGNRPWSDVTETTRRWVESNESVIAAALSWSPTSRLPDNNTPTDKPPSRTEELQTVALATERMPSHSSNLWLLAARRCEDVEQLDEAWHLHRLGFHAYRRLLNQEPSQYSRLGTNQYWHYERLAVWVWHPRQTSARLKRAISEVLADGEDTLPPEVVLAHEFHQFREAQRRRADTDHNAQGDWSWERWLFRRLCPAESQREQNVIDGLEAAHLAAFADFRPLTRDLSASWNQPAQSSPSPAIVVRPTWLIPSPSKVIGAGVPWVRGRAADLIAKTPRLNGFKWSSDSGQEWMVVRQFLNTQRNRRTLLLFMAQRAFELDHQRPPKSVNELVPAYLPQRPVTAVSGEDGWTLSQQPRSRLMSHLPADHVMQIFRWPFSVRDSLSSIRLEVSLTTPPRLIFGSP